MQEISPVPIHCPSFSSYSSVRFAEIASKVSDEFNNQREEFGVQKPNITTDREHVKTDEANSTNQSSNNKNEDEDLDLDDDDDNDDFEFAVVLKDLNTSLTISADEIFSNGRIKPLFPIFNPDLLSIDKKEEESSKLTKTSSRRLPLRRLFIEERNSSSSSSSSSSETEDHESVSSGTYCIWTPKSIPSSPDLCCKKSYSTGNKTKRFKLKDLIKRSNSDVNETYMFLDSSSKTNKKSNEKVENQDQISSEKKKNLKELLTKVKSKKLTGSSLLSGNSSSSSSSHEIHYLRNRALKEEDKRRSYLPYRKDLICFFANVNGFNRKLYPFQ